MASLTVVAVLIGTLAPGQSVIVKPPVLPRSATLCPPHQVLAGTRNNSGVCIQLNYTDLAGVSPGGGAAAKYAFSFTGQTQIVVPGTTHKLGTADLTLTCFDASTPSQRIEGDTWTIDANTYDVTLNFVEPQDGRCVLK